VADTSSERVAPELIDRMASELVKVPTRVWREMFSGLLAYDDLLEIGNISAPALLVWGDADRLVDRDMQTMLVERIRGAELIVYDSAGHTPRWEDPARFAADVAAFVQRSLHPGP
jgi:pimeloyl-ACP methyl ester carboxylesterase